MSEIPPDNVIIHMFDRRFSINYSNCVWSLTAADELIEILPHNLSFNLPLQNSDGVVHLEYIEVNPGDTDYPWILLNLVLNQEFPDLHIDSNNKTLALELLNKFINDLLRDVKTLEESLPNDEFISISD